MRGPAPGAGTARGLIIEKSMAYQWNWGVLLAPSPDGGQTYLQTLLDGLSVTVKTAALAWLIALALGLAVGVARTRRGPSMWKCSGTSR
jgi:glutamate/aspartate transport system permease protein